MVLFYRFLFSLSLDPQLMCKLDGNSPLIILNYCFQDDSILLDREKHNNNQIPEGSFLGCPFANEVYIPFCNVWQYYQFG